MEPENEHDDGEGNQKMVFVDTSLDTHLAAIVSDSDTVSDLKRKIILEHHRCFPAIGDIKIHSLKVKRRGIYYYLPDSTLVKTAFRASQKDWFLSVDASPLEQCDNIQHKPHDQQLALPWVQVSQAEGPSKLSKHSKIVVPFVNQKAPSVDHFTSDDSFKKVSKNIEEDRSSELELGLEQKLDSKVTEKLCSVDKEIKSKKRTRDVHNEDASVMKRRKTQMTESNVKAPEERVSTDDADKVKDIGTSINDENSIEDKSKSKDAAALDDVVTKAMNDEHTRTTSVKPKRAKKGKKFSHDQVDIVAPLSVEDAGEETLHQKNTEASEALPDVPMAVETNIQQEMSFQSKSKDAALDDVVTKDMNDEHTRTTSVNQKKLKRAKKGQKSSHDQVAIVAPLSVEDAGEETHHQKNTEASEFVIPDVAMVVEKNIHQETPFCSSQKAKSNELVEEADIGNEISSSSVKGVTDEDELLLKHADEKIIDEQKKDKTTNIISDEKSEVSEKTSMDDNKVDLIVKEVKIAEATESHRSHVHKEKSRKEIKETAGDRIKGKDVGKSSKEDELMKHSDDAATGMNEDNRLITSTDDLHVDNDVENSKTEIKTSQQNVEISETENMDDTQNKKKKRKKKKRTMKSAARNERVSLTNHANVNLLEKFADVSQRRAHSDDMPSELESEQEKSEIPEETSKNVTVSQVPKGNDVNSDVGYPKEGSHEIDFMDYFSPSQQQPNKVTPPLDNGENRKKDTNLLQKEKKQKKKSKEQNDNVVQSLSRNENNKVLSSKKIPEASTDEGVVKDQNTPNITKFKTQQDDSVIQSLSRNGNNKVLPSKKIPEASTDGVVVKDQNALNITKLKTQQDDGAVQSVSRNENNKVLSSKKIPEASTDGVVVKDQNAPGIIMKVKSQQDDSAVQSLSRNENNKVLPSKKIPEASRDGVVVKDQNAPNITKLKTQQDDGAVQSVSRNKNNKVLSSKKIPEASTDRVVVKDQNAPGIITKVKTQKTTKIDALKTSSKPGQVKKPQASSESESFGRSVKNQKKIPKLQPTMAHTQVKNLKRNVPGVKSLLNTPGSIFGDDSDDDSSSADDNANINSHSRSRNSSSSSSSSGDSDSTIDSRRYGVKSKEGGGKNNINSQSRLKKISMTDLLRSSSRYKKARFTASQVNETESEYVDFVPESQPVDKR